MKPPGCWRDLHPNTQYRTDYSSVCARTGWDHRGVTAHRTSESKDMVKLAKLKRRAQSAQRRVDVEVGVDGCAAAPHAIRFSMLSTRNALYGAIEGVFPRQSQKQRQRQDIRLGRRPADAVPVDEVSGAA
eukprot:2593681-Prymnesium_polylepis.3